MPDNRKGNSSPVEQCWRDILIGDLDAKLLLGGVDGSKEFLERLEEREAEFRRFRLNNITQEFLNRTYDDLD